MPSLPTQCPRVLEGDTEGTRPHEELIHLASGRTSWSVFPRDRQRVESSLVPISSRHVIVSRHPCAIHARVAACGRLCAGGLPLRLERAKTTLTRLGKTHFFFSMEVRMRTLAWLVAVVVVGMAIAGCKPQTPAGGSGGAAAPSSTKTDGNTTSR